MPDRFPSTGPMPSRQGHAPSLSTGVAAAQQGMVRIHRGAEVRYVWPVHVAGWLSSGWRVGEERSGGAATASAAAATVTAGAKAPPAAAPEPSVVAEATEPVSEPIEAHLPTNLLDLDLEQVAANPQASAPAEAPQQQAIEPSDAEPASFCAPGQAEVDAEGPTSAGPHDVDAGEQPAAALSDEPAAAASGETAIPAGTEPPQEELTPPPAPARRGRPRKVRPEAQPEPEAAPAAQGSAPVSANEGDDPFGLDPLL